MISFLGIAVSIIVWLNGCGIMKTVSKTYEIEWGKKGEFPLEVWKRGDWFCADVKTYRAEKK